MKIREGWRGFDSPLEGYKLDNEGKPVVGQSFVHNLNSQTNQVSAYGNTLVPIPNPPLGPPPIPTFVITDTRTFEQPFGNQGTRKKRSYILYLLYL